MTAVGRDSEDLPRSSHAQDRRLRQYGHELPLLLPEDDRSHASALGEEQLGGHALIQKDDPPPQRFAPQSIDDPLARPVGLVDGPIGRRLPEVHRMPAEGPFAQFPIDIAAQVHASVFQPDDLFPGRVDDLPDDILIGHAVGAFPGIEHMIDWLIDGIFRIHRGQSPLGGRRVRFLRMRHLRDRQHPGPRFLLEDLCGAPQPGAPGPDDQNIAILRGPDSELLFHECTPMIRYPGY